MKVFISNKEIEEIASGLIHVACGHQESGQIDIDSIARFLGLSVLYEQIMEEDMDKIGFLSNGSYPLYVNRQNQRVGGCLSKGYDYIGFFFAASRRELPQAVCPCP